MGSSLRRMSNAEVIQDDYSTWTDRTTSDMTAATDDSFLLYHSSLGIHLPSAPCWTTRSDVVLLNSEESHVTVSVKQPHQRYFGDGEELEKDTSEAQFEEEDGLVQLQFRVSQIRRMRARARRRNVRLDHAGRL